MKFSFTKVSFAQFRRMPSYKPTERDAITVRVRNFDVQPHQSRLCGFYAVAAALSVCNDVDPSGNRYDVDSLASCVSVAVNNRCMI